MSAKSLPLITTDPQQAVLWVQQGRLLAYPTESVWGIGCDPYNEDAVRQILAIKNRPIEKGMIVVTDKIDRIEPLLKAVPKAYRQTVIDSWQPNEGTQTLSERQATTWLLPLPTSLKPPLTVHSLSQIPSWITGNHDSVAVRVISHALIRELCEHMVSERNPYGFVVSTSCNRSGEAPATSFKQAYDYFAEAVCYLQGDTLRYTLPSQIKDAISGSTLR